jgi:hypothetical protein
MSITRTCLVLLSLCAGALTAAADAHATTFCVGAPAGCSGIQVAAGNLQAGAFQHTALSNGTPDEIVIGPGIYTTSTKWSLGPGTDPVTIRGAGPGATRLTSTSTTEGTVFDLYSSNHAVVLRDLAVEVPSTWLDGFTTYGLRVKDDLVENVAVISKNPRTGGIEATGTTTLRKVWVDAPVADAVRASYYGADLTVEDSVLSGATGVYCHTSDHPSSLTVARSTLAATAGAVSGVALSAGNPTEVRDSLLLVRTNGVASATGLSASGTSVIADHVTIVRPTGPVTATYGLSVTSKSTGTSQLVLENSIVHGVETVGRRIGATPPQTGAAKVVIADSILPAPFPAGSGNGTVDQATRNLVGVDPGFLSPADFGLAADSPAVDSGDPSFAEERDDLAGRTRIADGEGDGVARTDRGAYERPAPATSPAAAAVTPPAGAPSGSAPAPAAAAAPADPAPSVPVAAAPAGTSSAPSTAKARRCVVPRLRGRTLGAARKALGRAGCRVGRLTGARRGPVRVKSQKIRAGRRVAAGTKVALVLERKRTRRRR